MDTLLSLIELGASVGLLVSAILFAFAIATAIVIAILWIAMGTLGFALAILSDLSEYIIKQIKTLKRG